MKLLITGATRPLGRLAVRHFESGHQLRLTDYGPSADLQNSFDYQSADLRNPAEVTPLVEGIEAILHFDPYDLPPVSGAAAEQERLDLAARGTYVLLDEARKAGVERLIAVSTLAPFGAYPEQYIIDESWQPEPAPNADDLAPYLSEIVCREFAREGGIQTICLRFGPIDQPDGTPESDALQALSGALSLQFTPTGYRWQLYHVADSERFPMDPARQAFGFGTKGAN
jgi:nucleoside-diphosphate-sugar epimerase